MSKRTDKPKAGTRKKIDRKPIRRIRPQSDDEKYPDFVIGDGSELDLDDPDVCYALSMAKRD